MNENEMPREREVSQVWYNIVAENKFLTAI